MIHSTTAAPIPALRIARRIVAAYGGTYFLTNLKLNLLVYWCQVAALRRTGAPLFADEVTVGECGPIVPHVWEAYEHFGLRTVRERDEWQEEPLNDDAEAIVAHVVGEYAPLTVVDLLTLSSADDGVWSRAHARGSGDIGIDDILISADMRRAVPTHTLAHCVADVTREYANALRLLERS
ncbi:hypothetical protein B1400_0232 [Bifidobacterium italicum]|uniref:Antitoxin SocA-like Panacea domain-containing protein n=1 Tax=Bifidobacterium italicum TaxID=1960968 RepID=A0A2A2EM95_9BIFI|nr:type II toxin-antitoxin system antitoxin SocA domain-containing protein [Bifidobacterium italicum]PAU70038.1 hypothetical protein B1400_0232 [Bifidobacterium italicum]